MHSGRGCYIFNQLALSFEFSCGHFSYYTFLYAMKMAGFSNLELNIDYSNILLAQAIDEHINFIHKDNCVVNISCSQFVSSLVSDSSTNLRNISNFCLYKFHRRQQNISSNSVPILLKFSNSNIFGSFSVHIPSNFDARLSESSVFRIISSNSWFPRLALFFFSNFY